MDKEAMFLNGSIKKRVVTSTMRWFVDPKDARHVCKLQLSIHGRKQAYRSWNLHFDNVIKGFWSRPK